MKIDKLKIIKDLLEKERDILKNTINDTKKARDSAPSAMESHHDTDRNQNERIVAAFEQKYHDLDKLIQLLPNTIDVDPKRVELWSYTEITLNNDQLKIILVPEGYGGREFKGIKFISDSTPLGKTILNKKGGESFIFNEKEYKIQKIL